MDRKVVITLVLSLLIVSLSSCRNTSDDGKTVPQSPNTSPISALNSANPSSGENATQPIKTSPSPDTHMENNLTESYTAYYPLYFPLPYYHAFFGGSANEFFDSVDAFIHNSAVNYYSSRVDANSGHLLLVSLRLLDEWDTGSDETYYLCFMAQYDYYNLSELLLEKGYNRGDHVGDGTGYSQGRLIRFKLTQFVEQGPPHNITNFYGYSAIEILEEPMWGTNGGSIEELCGDRPIADTLLRAMNGAVRYEDVPYIRDILPSEYAHDKPALLEKYLQTYFPELLKFDS